MDAPSRDRREGAGKEIGGQPLPAKLFFASASFPPMVDFELYRLAIFWSLDLAY
jgi:hypothetical protein